MKTATLPDLSNSSLPAASRYFVAKYVPDLLRYEPRNVGVLLWTPQGLQARFLGEDLLGTLDSRRVPEWIGDASIYREWVTYWRDQCCKGLDSILGPLESLDYESETRIRDTLLNQISKAHWILAPGGVLLDPVKPDQEAATLGNLFSELVASKSLLEQLAEEPVDKIVTTLIKALALKKDPHFKTDYRVKVQSKDNYEITVDYAYVGKQLHRIWQTLPVFPQQKQMHTYADATAFRLNLLRETYGLRAEDMKVLYSMTTEQERHNKQTLHMVGAYAQVFNLHSTEDRLAIFSGLPKLDHLEGTPLSPTE